MTPSNPVITPRQSAGAARTWALLRRLQRALHDDIPAATATPPLRDVLGPRGEPEVCGPDTLTAVAHCCAAASRHLHDALTTDRAAENPEGLAALTTAAGALDRAATIAARDAATTPPTAYSTGTQITLHEVLHNLKQAAGCYGADPHPAQQVPARMHTVTMSDSALMPRTGDDTGTADVPDRPFLAWLNTARRDPQTAVRDLALAARVIAALSGEASDRTVADALSQLADIGPEAYAVGRDHPKSARLTHLMATLDAVAIDGQSTPTNSLADNDALATTMVTALRTMTGLPRNRVPAVLGALVHDETEGHEQEQPNP